MLLFPFVDVLEEVVPCSIYSVHSYTGTMSIYLCLMDQTCSPTMFANVMFKQFHKSKSLLNFYTNNYCETCF